MIPVVLVWRDPSASNPIRKHAILPALPMVGDLLIPPDSKSPRNVRAREWDLSGNGNGSAATILILLDD